MIYTVCTVALTGGAREDAHRGDGHQDAVRSQPFRPLHAASGRGKRRDAAPAAAVAGTAGRS